MNVFQADVLELSQGSSGQGALMSLPSADEVCSEGGLDVRDSLVAGFLTFLATGLSGWRRN